jgi:PTH1 family peptidyl-tRNA hydrolase
VKLIVGLGNYPDKYKNTKHNAGFICVDEFCKRHNITLDKTNFNGVFAKEDKFIIAQPHTLMNLSGSFVSEIINFYKINISDILIISDDIDTELGKIRVKPKGSSGGQNGLKDIINKLGTEEFKRIKIGISKPNKPIDIADYVLSNFNKTELPLLNQAIDQAIVVMDNFIGGRNIF